ncbi:MAG: hypothetical protein LBI79_07630 [Nitrososphaerota archaeon]|nr:hypothetical protein [Nitrososphaerota archaeon]
MSEKFSAETSVLREEMRLVSAITALNLIQEKRYEEAEPFRSSFIEIKDSSVETLAKDLGSHFLPNGNATERIAAKMLEVAATLSKTPETIEENEAKVCASILMELLDAVTVSSR